jgi:PPOX class probable F420-dependent enzyme
VIGTPEQDAFINTNKWAVVTVLRKDCSPASSVVFYAREGDVLFFSTTAPRLKARALERDPRIVLTALEEGSPYGYVSVEGTATIHSPERGDDTLPWHAAILKTMLGPAAEPTEEYVQRLRKERRVIVRVTPQRVSGVPDRGRRIVGDPYKR